jgi:hypothetical protein
VKRVILSVAAGLMLLGAGSALAEPVQAVQRWKLGAEISGIAYEEPGVMKEDGMMYGIAGSWANHRDGAMVRIEGKFSYGLVDYVNSGTLDDIDDYMLEFRMLWGRELPILKPAVVMAYAGLGYRYLNDDSGGRQTSTGAWGYERESNYLYIPVGVEALVGMDKGWSLGAALEYDVFLWGKQISHLSDVSLGYNDLENEQREGYGYRGSIELRKKWRSKEFAVEPFIRYWEIKQSDYQKVIYNGAIVGYGYEPKNSSRELGVRLSVIF